VLSAPRERAGFSAFQTPDSDGNGLPERYLVARSTCSSRGLEVIGSEVPAFDANDLDPGPDRVPDLVSACLEPSDVGSQQGFVTFSTGLNWQTTKRFSTFLRYRWSKRTSGGEIYAPEFDDNAITLGFTYSYDIDLY